MESGMMHRQDREFWENFKAHTYADTPFFRSMWNGFKFYNPNITSTEFARRYWSFFQLACCSSPFGGISPNLCNAFILYDSKYYSRFNNFFSYDYQMLPNQYGASSVCHRRFQDWNKLDVFKNAWIKLLGAYMIKLVSTGPGSLSILYP
jgi:hypothetical protein